jgi:hypothetical protein
MPHNLGRSGTAIGFADKSGKSSAGRGENGLPGVQKKQLHLPTIDVIFRFVDNTIQ